METYTLRPRTDPRPGGTFRIDYAGELNEAQCLAATTIDGPVLVIAGAGSGKTRTLVYRVARLVESGIPPARILLLTFTRKAAEEMLRRASALVGGNCDRVSGGTFHSFANTVLRRTGRKVGLEPGFTILDRGDSEDVINLLRSRAGLDRKDRRFPRKGAILEILSMAVNRSTTVEDLVADAYGHLADHLDDLVKLGSQYERYKREKQLVDYDDLLVLLRDLLRDHPDVAEQLSRGYRYVMVDEYQDTNALQAEIVRGLAVAHDNVMAVGDDSQSIYSFRGATFRNIMDFPALFPGTRVVKLRRTTGRRSPSSGSRTPSSTVPPRSTPRYCGPAAARGVRRCSSSVPTSRRSRASSRSGFSSCAKRASRWTRWRCCSGRASIRSTSSWSSSAATCRSSSAAASSSSRRPT